MSASDDTTQMHFASLLSEVELLVHAAADIAATGTAYGPVSHLPHGNLTLRTLSDLNYPLEILIRCGSRLRFAKDSPPSFVQVSPSRSRLLLSTSNSRA